SDNGGWTRVSSQGPRVPVSKSPFLTIGVEAEQAPAGFTFAVRVVWTVVADGIAVRIQEQALLTLAGGYVGVAN
ncbi:MAG: hypothetical protein Q9180_008111, partial [Flavoplaca navasiana]